MDKKTQSPVYLAVDLGAGSGRVIAGILENGRLRLEEIHRFANDGVHLVDTWTWNTTGLFANILVGLKKAGDRFGDAVRSLGVDTWGVDYGLVDERGDLLGLPAQYRDGRTEGMMEKAFEKMPAEELYAATGNQFMFYNTVFQLLAEQERNPGRLDAAAGLLWMPDLLSYWLSGTRANEATIASTAQLVNAATGDWAWDVIERLGLPKKLFGDITSPGTVLGPLLPQIAEQTGLNAKVVAVGGHDTASAVAAVPAREANSVYLSSGTWSLLGVVSPQAVINAKSFDLAFTNEGGVGGDIRLLKILCGLWLIQECKRDWDEDFGEVDWDTLIQEAADAPAFVSLVDPDDPRFAAPGNMPARLEDWCRETGQPVPNTRGAMARMIFESLALKYRVVFDKLADLVGHDLGTFHIVGGGGRNALLNQFAADALNRTVVAGPVEATAAGNILMQLVADGAVEDLPAGKELIRNSFDVQTFAPMAPSAWEAVLPRFQSLCKSSAGGSD
ncbi:MAG: rhamnulokinase [Verrucomicrobia bacterium]|nr:rhamnulokinase [Verrucomicrobiota bacterium]MCH8512517.1 rhamnulokinase [Kiritimatiellia bacterium]